MLLHSIGWKHCQKSLPSPEKNYCPNYYSQTYVTINFPDRFGITAPNFVCNQFFRGSFFSKHPLPGSTKLLQVKVQVANNNCEEIIKQEIGLKVDLATQICAGGEKGKTNFLN